MEYTEETLKMVKENSTKGKGKGKTHKKWKKQRKHNKKGQIEHREHETNQHSRIHQLTPQK